MMFPVDVRRPCGREEMESLTTACCEKAAGGRAAALQRVVGDERLSEALDSHLVVGRDASEFVWRQRGERPGSGLSIARPASRQHLRGSGIQARVQQLPGLEPEDASQLEEHVRGGRRPLRLDAGNGRLSDASFGREPQEMDLTPVVLHEGHEIAPDDAGRTELVHRAEVWR